MRHLVRALAVALAFSLPAAAPVAASRAVTGASPSSAANVVSSLSAAKVVIIVGPVESSTSSYRSIADSIYAEAIRWSSNVIRIYSPNATWAVVKPALQGANIVVYLGHGNGWPAPYPFNPAFVSQNGMGLNAIGGAGDANTRYYGEPYFANEIQFAANAVVLLNHLCYASGNSEPGQPNPSLSVAMQRADNFGQGFIRAGARAVIAEGLGSVNGIIRDLFATRQTVLDVWRNQSGYNGNEFSFQSMRSPSYTDFMDPQTPTGGYYRSLVGNPDLRTEAVTGVSDARTDVTPVTLQNPGAATVAAGGTTVYADAGLSTATGSFPAGTVVRINNIVGSPASAVSVQGLAGGVGGWTSPGALSPQDSVGPQLWSAVGARNLSPNGDGIADSLDLRLQFSESVSWSVEFRDSGGVRRWVSTGTGETPTIAWNLMVGSNVVADGRYSVRVSASDAWGNPPMSVDIPIIVDTMSPTRLAGVDRYATSASISTATYAPGVAIAYVATGLDFPDALAGAAAAGSQHAPILLATRDAIPSATALELTRLQPGRIVVLGASGVVSDSVAGNLAAYTTGTVTRLAGSDRYATAAAVSAATYAPGVAIAYVATGLNFPDALAGAAAAGSQGAPVLLVGQDAIPDATATELARLHPGRIIVLGGTGVVSDGIATALRGYTTGTVTRLAGADRYDTAAATSAATFGPRVTIAYLATGENFPDALAGAAAAGFQNAPILLVSKDSIPAATAAELRRLQPGRVVILGSTGVVSEVVRIQVLLNAR